MKDTGTYFSNESGEDGGSKDGDRDKNGREYDIIDGSKDIIDVRDIMDDKEDIVHISDSREKQNNIEGEDIHIVRFYPPKKKWTVYTEDISLLNIRLGQSRAKYRSSFFKDLLSKEHSTCSICLNPFSNHNKVLSLLCTHYFHSRCIIPWIKKHKRCPCCRIDA